MSKGRKKNAPLLPVPEPDKVLALRRTAFRRVVSAREGLRDARREFEEAVYLSRHKGMVVKAEDLPVGTVVYGRTRDYGYYRDLHEESRLGWFVMVCDPGSRYNHWERIKKRTRPGEDILWSYYGALLYASQLWLPNDPAIQELNKRIQTALTRRALLHAAKEKKTGN